MSCSTCWLPAYTATLIALAVISLATYAKVYAVSHAIKSVDQRSELSSSRSSHGRRGSAPNLADVLRSFKASLTSIVPGTFPGCKNRVKPDASVSNTNTVRSFKQSAAMSGKQMTRVLSHAALPISRIFSPSASPRVLTENDWVISPRDIKMGEKVAGGSFGEVYTAEYMGSIVAVKVPNKDIPIEMFNKFVIEVELMVGLHHPNIVRFIGACLTMGSSFLVLEYLEKGCLYDFLRTEECAEFLTYPKMIKFATDTARGMRYLHSRAKIIQRDLKSRNLLIDYAYNVKICDFGLSRYAGSNEQMTACGTPYWAAPEVILGKAYNEKADVFSFAIVMWEICAREEPYDGRPGIDTAIEVAQNGLRPKIPKSCPGAYRKLMESAWAHNPRERPGMEQILERLFEMGKDARAKALLSQSTANSLGAQSAKSDS